jgi:putative ABC transport system permease protein
MAQQDARLLLTEMQPWQTYIDQAIAPTRFALTPIAIFGAVAAVLALVGLYGVLATTVRQRTTEIGVRMAFGAPRSSILRLVVGQGVGLSVTGIAVGIVAAIAVTRVMASLLVGVSATDPLTFAVIALSFAVIAAIAAWLPARRAAALDPQVALRQE